MADVYDGPIFLQSKNYPKHLVGFTMDGEVTMGSKGKRFLMVPGLTGDHGTVSFRSVDKDDFYLRHADSVLYCEHVSDNRNPGSFNEDATFRVHKDRWMGGYFCFESVNFPDHYIRHYDYRLRISNENEEADPQLFHDDASWRPVEGPFKLQSKNYPDNFVNMDGDEAYINTEGTEFYLVRPGMKGGTSAVSLLPIQHQCNCLLRHFCSELYAECPEDCRNPESMGDDASFFISPDRFSGGYFALESINFPEHFVRHANSRVRIDQDDGTDVMHEDASFRTIKGPMAIYSYNYPEQGFGYNGDKEGYMQEDPKRFYVTFPGLNRQPGSVSFEAVEFNNHFLRHYDYELQLEDQFEGRNVASLPEDASFRMKEDTWFEGTVVFESWNFPNHYIRHECGRLKISEYEDSDLFRKDASFRLQYEI